MKTEELRELVKNFRNGILNGDSVKGECFEVCDPLSDYLNSIGLKNKLIRGFVDDGYKEYRHYWIQFRRSIIDPTCRQFKKSKGNDIFIGRRPDWYFLEFSVNTP